MTARDATTREEIARLLEAEVDAVERFLDGPGCNYSDGDMKWARGLVADHHRRIRLLREKVPADA